MDASQKTLWVGNLPENITEELLYELFLQVSNAKLYIYSFTYIFLNEFCHYQRRSTNV